MALLITGSTVSEAWVSALEALAARGGVAINLCVAIVDPCRENPLIRRSLDGFLREQLSGRRSVETVANTIFPHSLYRGEGEQARARLYQRYTQRAYPVLQRHSANRHGTYFQRLVAYPQAQEPINQLERVILRLQGQVACGKGLSSVYEMGVSTGEDATHELRIQCAAKGTRTIGFPCLSHISLTLEERRLHLTATYRNQYFITRAYGNYLGLGHLLAFLCKETGCVPGEVLCIATHADAEFKARGIGKGRVLGLLNHCTTQSMDEWTCAEDVSLKEEQRNGRAVSERQSITR